MFCYKCGTQLPDEAVFCSHCGTKVNIVQDAAPSAPAAQPTPQAEPQAAPRMKIPPIAQAVLTPQPQPVAQTPQNAAVNNPLFKQANEIAKDTNSPQYVNELMNKTIDYIENVMKGYYCICCGCYIDFAKLRYTGQLRCPTCGVQIIGTTEDDNQAPGWGFAILNKLLKTNQDPYFEIKKYYSSDYFKATGYSFEHVLMDKGLVGEYMIDIAFCKARGNRPARIFYNVQIPEPNGSFQEVDAVIVYGGIFAMVEAKNRIGRYQYKHISDPEWTLIGPDGATTVHSPLLQNMEHTIAFQRYYNDALRKASPRAYTTLAGILIYNLVTLGPKSDFNVTIDEDEYDHTILGSYIIHAGGGLEEHISNILGIVDALRAPQDILTQTLKSIELLKDIIEPSEEDKNLMMRNRMADHRNKGKSDYKYYYLKYKYGIMPKGALIRTNGVYVQSYDKSSDWGQDELVTLEDGKLVGKFITDLELIDLHNMPLEIVKAKRCAESGQLYEP